MPFHVQIQYDAGAGEGALSGQHPGKFQQVSDGVPGNIEARRGDR